MGENACKIYIIVGAILIVALLLLVAFYWKQKQDCEHKEGLCLCNGPQMNGRCKPYNLFSNLDIDVNSPRKSKGPAPLKMPYDVLQYGYRKTNLGCSI